MRITYRTLAKLIDKMSDEQKDYDVTVEDENMDECFAAELRIGGEDHDSLDPPYYPVLYIPTGELDPRSDNVEMIWDLIKQKPIS